MELVYFLKLTLFFYGALVGHGIFVHMIHHAVTDCWYETHLLINNTEPSSTWSQIGRSFRKVFVSSPAICNKCNG